MRLKVLLHLLIMIVNLHLLLLLLVEAITTHLHISVRYIHAHLIQEVILFNLLIPQEFFAEIIWLLEIKPTTLKSLINTA